MMTRMMRSALHCQHANRALLWQTATVLPTCFPAFDWWCSVAFMVACMSYLAFSRNSDFPHDDIIQQGGLRVYVTG